MFCLGKILYMMLLGHYLCTNQYRVIGCDVNPQLCIDQLKEHIQQTEAKRVSDEAIACVQHLLQVKPADRPVVIPRNKRETSILDHPWLQQGDQSNLPREYLKRLRDCNQQRQQHFLDANQ
eukprot:gb/GECG01001353.1/.p1 GENE.gb/GECG01001353.1/~~gb/GECG01001353.1/.p1  ORF type:complete len:121 (+),score=7.09 gb/GECG01001353.1/:1-363(+)